MFNRKQLFLALAAIYSFNAFAAGYEFRKSSPGLAVVAPSTGPGGTSGSSGGTTGNGSTSGNGASGGGATGGGSSPAPVLTYQAELSSGSIDFGEVRVGTSLEKTVRVSNTGTGGLSIGVPTTTGAAYSAATQCGASLPVAGECLVNVTFNPQDRQTYAGNLTIPLNTSASLAPVTLQGVGVASAGALTADTSFDFGQAVVGTPVTRAFTFTNSGNADALSVFAKLTGNAAFSIDSTSCGTESATATVAKNNGTCTVTVRYAPTSSSAGTSTSLAVNYEQTRSVAKTLTASARYADSAGSALKLLIPANTSIADVSLAPKTLTLNGTARLGTTNKYGGGSIEFDGANATSSVIAASSADFGFGTGDFTIEAWVYPNGAQQSYSVLMDFRAPGSSTQTKPTIYVGASGSSNVNIRYYTKGSNISGLGTVVPVNNWYHVAYSRTSGVGKFFVNGAQVGGDYADSNNYGTGSDIVIGNVGDNRSYTTGYLKGFIDDVRVTKGVGRYTSNFNVPAEHPLP